MTALPAEKGVDKAGKHDKISENGIEGEERDKYSFHPCEESRRTGARRRGERDEYHPGASG